MEVKIFSIFDEKGKAFMPPFFRPHHGQAVRDFSDLVSDKSTSINKHPEDFKLYCLGVFDDVSGGLSPVAQPEFIGNAKDFLNNS